MKHKKQGRKFGRKSDSRKALMRSLATNFIIYEKIKTTQAKAKDLRMMVEKIITKAKKDTLHNRRQIMKVLYLAGAVKKVFEVLGPRFKNRPGGYTRIVKLPSRLGDAAKMAVLELVEEEEKNDDKDDVEVKKEVKKTVTKKSDNKKSVVKTVKNKKS